MVNVIESEDPRSFIKFIWLKGAILQKDLFALAFDVVAFDECVNAVAVVAHANILEDLVLVLVDFPFLRGQGRFLFLPNFMVKFN